MATHGDFWHWLNRDLLRRFADLEHVESVGAEGSPGEFSETICLYTETNCYTIRIVQRERDAGYLGCGASSRKPRAGEDWTRGGRDLPDGPLTEETWREILAAIVSYEMVRVHRRRGPVADDGSPEITVYDSGDGRSVEWDQATGAVRVLPHGKWLHPDSRTRGVTSGPSIEPEDEVTA